MTNAYQLLYDISVLSIKFKEMAVQKSIRSLHILKGFNLAPSQKQHSIKLRLKNVQILKQSLCDCLHTL